MRSPSASPPSGAIGYWSDGGEHVAVVIVTEIGRRLFLEFDADGVVRTNIAEYVYDDLK